MFQHRTLLLSFLFCVGLSTALDVSLFKEKLASKLTDEQIAQVAQQYNGAKNKKQAINKFVKTLSERGRKSVKKTLREILEADKYLNGLFNETLEAASDVVDEKIIQQFEDVKEANDTPFKKNFAVAVSALAKGAAKIVSAEQIPKLQEAFNKPLLKFSNDTKRVENLKAKLQFFQ